MRSVSPFLDRHNHVHSSHAARPEKAVTLMVESKHNKLRLAATPSQLQSQLPAVHRGSSSSSKNDEAWRDMERINVQEIKDQIMKQVGVSKAKMYFSHFRSFMSCRLSKHELDKLVIKTIGKENLTLHNKLVRAILANAVKAKLPPPPSQPVQHAPKPPLIPHSPCITSDDTTIQNASPSTLSNGDSFICSPRRGRAGAFRDHKASPLGPRQDHLLDGVVKLLDAESNNSLEPPSKRARILCPASDDSLCVAESAAICGESNRVYKEEREEIIPPFSFGSSMKVPWTGSSFFQSSTSHRLMPQALPTQMLLETLKKSLTDSMELPDGDALHMYMKQVATTERLEGVSRDSAEILNLALDAYLRRLIKFSVNVLRPQSTNRSIQSGSFSSDKSFKEVLSGPKVHQTKNGVCPVGDFLKKDEEKVECSISLTDFKLAMDLNPRLLGEAWPLQLEKISFHMHDQ